MSTDLQPDVSEVLQTEEPYGDTHIVKVQVCGPTRTQPLPRKGGATFTKTVGVLGSVIGAANVLRADHRRAVAYLVAASPFLVAYNDANAQSVDTMATIPANVLLPVSATVDVWVAAPTATVAVSVLVEDWATGEGIS